MNEADKRIFEKLNFQKADKEILKSSLLLLTRMISARYVKLTVLLIDEYDVMSASASENGY